MSVKKAFRVVGIPYGKGVIPYAEKLEETMNKMKEDGYAFQISELKTGTLVIGQLIDPRPEVQEAAAHDVPTPRFSPRTRELYARFIRFDRGEGDLNKFVSDVKTHAPALTKDFSLDDLFVAAKELDIAATEHAAHPAHESKECFFAAALRTIARVLRGQTGPRLS